MKLHHLLQKCSFFLIKLAVFLASGAAYMKHFTNAEVGLRPVRAIGAYAPEGMWNAEGWSRSPRRRRYNPYEPEAALCLFLK